MPKDYESGRKRFIKGSLIFLWEELKTMNRIKFRALSKIASGYLKMKLLEQKTNKKAVKQIPTYNDFHTW